MIGKEAFNSLSNNDVTASAVYPAQHPLRAGAGLSAISSQQATEGL